MRIVNRLLAKGNFNEQMEFCKKSNIRLISKLHLIAKVNSKIAVFFKKSTFQKKVIIKKILAILAILFCFTSCGNQEELKKRQEEDRLFLNNNSKVKVLSTTAMINDLVKEVGGDHVNAISLIKGDLDPHSYQLVKGDDEKLLKADIIFFNGLGLEHGPSLQHYLYNSDKSISLGNKIEAEDPALILRQKGQVDPHIWMDISLFSKAVPFIKEALIKKDPSNKEEYTKNADLLLSEMKKYDEEIRELLLEIPTEKRYLVTSHDAFNYFTKAYLATSEEKDSGFWQKRFQAPEGLAPESQISASDIQYIIDHLQVYNIHVLFPESNVSQDSIRKIVQAGKEKGLEVTISKEILYGDAMGSPGSDADTYLKMIRHNAEVISSQLKGN